MSALNLDGLIPATLTPFTDAYAVDEAALRKYIRWLLSFQGLKGVAVNMDTGEGPHLTREEKRRILFEGGYFPPEHPLEGISRLFRLTAEMQEAFPHVPAAGSGYSWLRQ
jgi:hypothetical protein